MELDFSNLYAIYKTFGYSFVPVFIVIFLVLAILIGWLDKLDK
jgi:hypothetical protein